MKKRKKRKTEKKKTKHREGFIPRIKNQIRFILNLILPKDSNILQIFEGKRSAV